MAAMAQLDMEYRRRSGTTDAWDLPENQTFRLTPGPRGVVIRVDRGRVVITQEGDQEDYVLGPGEEIRMWGGDLVVVWAVSPSSFIVADVGSEAGSGGFMYCASIENRGDSTYHATTRHSTFVMATDGHGANPVDAMLASLCACIGHYARDYLREERISASKLTVKAEAQGTADGARLAEIAIRIDVDDAHLDEGRRGELVQRAERCKIHNTLKAGCALRITVGPTS